MDTVTRDDDNGTGRPLPPPDVTPYFQRAALEEAAKRRGLPYQPWAA